MCQLLFRDAAGLDAEVVELARAERTSGEAEAAAVGERVDSAEGPKVRDGGGGASGAALDSGGAGGEEMWVRGLCGWVGAA